MAVLALGRLGTLALRWAHETGLDAEFAEPQPVVGIQLDHGAREQVVVVMAGVLQQVAAELLCELGLVVLEALLVLGTEPDRVLVGNVDPLHRGGLVRVHLLGELPRDLHRLHAGAEGATEDAFDEALDSGFEVAQDADSWLLDPWGWPARGRTEPKC